MSRTVRSGDWDLRLATISPILPGRWGLAASAFAATGQLSRAQELARRGLAVSRAVAASPEVAAWVLGRRVHRVHYRHTVHGVAFDRLGRLRLDALYRPREVIRGGG